MAKIKKFKREIEAIIFDFDGVILDSFFDQFKWFQYICSVLKKDFKYDSLDAFREDYREPVYPNMYTFFGFDWNSEKDIIWKEYNNYKANTSVSLFDGIDKVIQKLRSSGFRLAISSSNTQEIIYKQLQSNALETYFEVIIGKNDLPIENGEPQLKPHPACILLTLDKLNCLPNNAIYIGDQPTDIIAARKVADYKKNPISIIAVTYGYSSRRKLEELKPDYIIDKLEEIIDLI